MASRIGKLAKKIAAQINDLNAVALDTPADALWYPDWDSADIKPRGLQCWVFPQNSEHALAVRGHSSPSQGVDSPAEIHIAALYPKTNNDWDNGDRAVALAETIQQWALGNRLTDDDGRQWRGIESEHSPIIAVDWAKQYNIWVSYLRTTWRGEN